MNEFTRELIPVLVMYGFVVLLSPFIGVTLWVMFVGDRDAAIAAATRASIRAVAPSTPDQPLPLGPTPSSLVMPPTAA